MTCLQIAEMIETALHTCTRLLQFPQLCVWNDANHQQLLHRQDRRSPFKSKTKQMEASH